MRPLNTDWQRKWLALDVHDPAVQTVADRVEAFAARWAQDKDGPALLVFYGPPGTAKTHIASHLAAWARHVSIHVWTQGFHAQPPTVLFQSWSEVASPEVMPDHEFHLWRRDLARESLLILDDVGTETDRYKTGIPTERLRLVLNERANKPTLITTNVPPGSWASVWDERVADRLLRGSQVVEMDCQSYAVASL